ncbi:UNVERIFIED_CONTAM: hypothetical protein GTU68_029653 [Idotea baltica]|nr:hypothetical protein [Idotea baltica]
MFVGSSYHGDEFVNFESQFQIYLGASLNCAGAIIRAFGTSGVIEDLDAQYAVSLTGQVVAAMSQSFLLFIPTKVSQLWFPESQRALSTTVLAMSNPLGIVIAEGATPFIVNEDENNIPTNNYVWMGLAIVGFLCTLVSITR